jgi:hypothetical protein
MGGLSEYLAKHKMQTLLNQYEQGNASGTHPRPNNLHPAAPDSLHPAAPNNFRPATPNNFRPAARNNFRQAARKITPAAPVVTSSSAPSLRASTATENCAGCAGLVLRLEALDKAFSALQHIVAHHQEAIEKMRLPSEDVTVVNNIAPDTSSGTTPIVPPKHGYRSVLYSLVARQLGTAVDNIRFNVKPFRGKGKGPERFQGTVIIHALNMSCTGEDMPTRKEAKESAAMVAVQGWREHISEGNAEEDDEEDEHIVSPVPTPTTQDLVSEVKHLYKEQLHALVLKLYKIPIKDAVFYTTWYSEANPDTATPATYTCLLEILPLTQAFSGEPMLTQKLAEHSAAKVAMENLSQFVPQAL